MAERERERELFMGYDERGQQIKRKERKKIEFEENDNHLLISIHSKLAS